MLPHSTAENHTPNGNLLYVSPEAQGLQLILAEGAPHPGRCSTIQKCKKNASICWIYKASDG
jgi:hypothetical protein